MRARGQAPWDKRGLSPFGDRLSKYRKPIRRVKEKGRLDAIDGLEAASYGKRIPLGTGANFVMVCGCHTGHDHSVAMNPLGCI